MLQKLLHLFMYAIIIHAVYLYDFIASHIPKSMVLLLNKGKYGQTANYTIQSTLCPPKLTLWNVIYNRKVVTASDVYAHSGHARQVV